QGRGPPLMPRFRVVGAPLLIAKPDRQHRLLRAFFVVSAILVALLTMTITTVQYRHFLVVTFLTLPMAVFLVERFVARRWLYVAGAIALAALVIRMYPALDFHARYNTQQRFFHGLRGALDANAVLVTTDHSGLARHYLGARRKPHAPDPTERQAQQFVQEIRDGVRRTHYVLPDAFAYDGYGTFGRALREAFTFEPVYGQERVYKLVPASGGS